MKYKNVTQVVLLLLLGCCAILFGQPEMPRPPQVELTYFFDVVNVQVPNNPEMSRLNAYLEVRYDDLQFIKTDDGFEAEYECTIVVYDRSDDFQVDGKIWKEKITVDEFEQTNSIKKFAFTFSQFDLEPADYKVLVSVEDLESGRTQARQFKIEARNFLKKELSTSDIAFLKSIEYDSLGVKSISPTISQKYKGLLAPAYAYFEIYNQTDDSTASIEYKIIGMNSKDDFKGTLELSLTGERTLAAIALPVDSLKHDGYELEIKTQVGKHKSTNDKVFYVRWEGIPYTAQDLETAIKQVEFIASPDEWKRLTKADDKLQEFTKFWKRHDPTPGTTINEAMEAHYGRIEYANLQFSVLHRDGWRTDRGMVFIVLGPPDDVDRNPYPSNSDPWEIWSYYKINRRFEFVDYSGFGDYRFYRPYSMYELQLYMR